MLFFLPLLADEIYIMKATHHDLEVILNKDILEEQSVETLKALQKVPIKPSNNPRYTQKMQDAHRRIQLILNEKEKKIPWNWIFLWLTIAGIIISSTLAIIL